MTIGKFLDPTISNTLPAHIITMNNFIKFKGIIISLLFGIVFLQALWIYNSYKERKAHLNMHIENAVIHAVNKYYLIYDSNKTPISDTLLERLIFDELSYLDEKPNLEIIIITKSANNNKPKTGSLVYNIKSPENNDDAFIEIKIIDERSYLFGALFSWIGLSFIFIILLSFFTTIYLRNINVQGQIQKMKDEFTSNMTHELKTPISTISVASEILQNDRVHNDKEKIKRYANIIYEENNRLKWLVDRVMQVALFERGKLNINMIDEDVNEVILDVAKPLQILIAKHNGIINLNLDNNNPIVKIDKIHFSNVISNLVENAIKYSNSKPEINISSKLNSNSYTIEISDNGIGIEEEKIKNIFKKYYRVKNINTEYKTGFGLGLFYVYQIVKAHKAEITVDSKINVGTTFKITFLV